MTHPKELPLASLQFYATAPYPCSYLPGRMARSQVATPSHLIHADAYSGPGRQRLPAQRHVHLPPVLRRLPRLRAAARAGRDLQADAQPAPRRARRTATSRRACCACASCPSTTSSTCATRPAATSAAAWTTTAIDQYTQFLLQSRVNSRLVEFREPAADGHGALKMVSILDVLNDGLSAVYTFFEPEPRTSYGTYSVLWQIEQTRLLRPAARLPRLLDRPAAARWPTRRSSARTSC